MRGSIGWMVLTGVVGLLGQTGWGQAPAVTDRAQLPALARSLKGSYTAVGPGEVEAARDRLQTAMHTLQQSLEASGPQNAARWREYLAWDTLVAESMNMDGPDSAEIQKVIKQFAGRPDETIYGLELPHFVAVRERLQELRRIAVIAAEPGLENIVPVQLEKLAVALETYHREPTNEGSAEVGRLVGWLQRHQQARPLITSVQRHFLIPNLETQLSERFLTDIQRGNHIQRSQPVHDQIMKTSVHGTAHMDAHKRIDMLPGTEYARGRVVLQGQIFTEAVGYQGPVTICSHSQIDICAMMPVIVTPTGVRNLPASATADVHSFIDDIQAKHRFVERIAWRKAGKQKGQAEAVASSHAAERLRAQMDQEGAVRTAEMNAELDDAIRKPLIRRGLKPYWQHYSSTDSHLLIHTLSMALGQVGSATPPPALTKMHDVDLRIHESGIANIGEQILGGVKLTSDRMEEIRKDSGLPKPKKQAADEEGADAAEEDEEEELDWAITFTWERPVQVRFAPDGFSVVIRASELMRKDANDKKATINGDIQIAAAYKLVPTQYGTSAQREGRVEVKIDNPLFNKRPVADRDVTVYKAFLRKKFGNVLPDTIDNKAIRLPKRLEHAGHLLMRHVQTAGEWVTLGLELVPGLPPEVIVTSSNKAGERR